MNKNYYHRTLAIDIGYRNFSWIVLDNLRPLTPRVWNVEDLWVNQRKKPTRSDIYKVLRLWCARNHAQLEMAHSIVIESQMRKLYIAMESFLVGKYSNKTTTVHPKSICSFWNLPGKREAKKQATIDLCKSLDLQFPAANKFDDLADTFVIAARQLVLRGGVSKETFSAPSAQDGSRKLGSAK